MELNREQIIKMSYESPIKIAIGEFQMEQKKRIEGDVFLAIQEYGITVDKEELIKALQYDRDQYRKGYEDGVQAKADTLMDIQMKFAMHFGTYTKDATVKVDDVFKLLARIKEEMLEEG